MKNMFKKVGIIALAAVIGFAMTGCSNPSTSDTTPTSVKYVNNDDQGNSYELEIYDPTSRDAYRPQPGHKYTLTVKNSSKQETGRSTGTVTAVPSNGTFTLKSSKAQDDTTFTVEVSGSSIKTITVPEGESIPNEIGEEENATITVGTLTPISGGSTDPALNGTWVGQPYTINDPSPVTYTDTFTLDNGTFEKKITSSDGSYNNTPTEKGTYTTSGGSITNTITHLWGGEPLEERWYTIDEVIAIMKNNNYPADVVEDYEAQLRAPQTVTYSISGNTLTITSSQGQWATYTRQR